GTPLVAGGDRRRGRRRGRWRQHRLLPWPAGLATAARGASRLGAQAAPRCARRRVLQAPRRRRRLLRTLAARPASSRRLARGREPYALAALPALERARWNRLGEHDRDR